MRVSWIITTEHADANGGGAGAAVPGRLGLCFCPGKKVTRDGILWDRDLAADLCKLRDTFRATTIVCLLNTSELRHLKVPKYVEEVKKCGLKLEHYPIIEMAAPKDVNSAHELICRIAESLRQGEVVIMHCRGGVGRAGLMAACVLLRLGLVRTGDEAIAEVRRRRGPEAVESRNQEDFVRRYAGMVAKDEREPAKAQPG